MNKTSSAIRRVFIVTMIVCLLVIIVINKSAPRDILLLILFVVIAYIVHRPTRRLINRNIRALFSSLTKFFGVDSVETSGLSDKSLIALPAQGYPEQSYWYNPRVYTIKLPKETDWRPDQSTYFISRVVQLGRVILRIKATRDEIVWQLIDANKQVLPADEVRRAIKSAFVEADVSEPELCYASTVGDGFWRRIDFYQQTDEFLRPSLRANDIRKTDPLMGIVNSFVDFQEGEWASYTLAFGGMGDDLEKLYDVGIHNITKSKAEMIAWGMLGALLSGNEMGTRLGEVAGKVGGRLSKYDTVTMQACQEKIDDVPLIRCFIAIEANSPFQQRLDHFEYGIPFMQHFSSEYQTFTHTTEPAVHITHTALEQRTNVVSLLAHLLTRPLLPLDPRACVFATSEMAALWHLPHTGMTATEIGWQKGKQVAAPSEFRKEKAGVKLGINKPTGSEIYQPLSERVVHTLVIGKTGTGKTSFLQALILQDIEAGRGVAVLEPLGGLVKRILQYGVPVKRVDDVVILDIGFRFPDQGNAFYPPPLNPVAKLRGVNDRTSANEFAAILGKLFEDTDQTRWMQLLQAALELLTAEEHPILDDLLNVIDDRAYRNQLISRFEPRVLEKWARLERGGVLNENSIQPVIWRLSQFLDIEIARASTCHPDKLDLYSIIRENKILLVSVHADEGLIPKSAQNILGAIILSQIQMAAMAGAVADPKNRPFMVYVDEVQDFATHSLDELARQARQKGLGLVVATQDTSTIAPKTLKALKGNIGTLVAFECNAEDAHNALDLMPGFSVPDLMNMGRFKAVISMRSPDGVSRAAFSLDPLAAPDLSNDPNAQSRELYLRHKSVENYTPMSYDEVTAWLNARYRPQEKQAKVEDEQNDFGNPITN